MYRQYLLTGATGFLGSHVAKLLARRGARVRALVLPGDPNADSLPPDVERVVGSVTERDALAPLFDDAEGKCVVHCAGIVSVATRPGPALRRVNVDGTRNVVSLCRERGAAKLVYVSSVHAIPDRPRGCRIEEIAHFAPEAVAGPYARSKAEATAIVLAAARAGLNASVVHPSGIIGPGDIAQGSVSGLIANYCAGRFPVGVKGGYDFVDVRDVAEGLLSCCERGRAGEGYILSGHYVRVREILEGVRALTGGRKIYFDAPLKLAALIAPFYEGISLLRREPLYFTPYAVRVLGTNANFSREKAGRELDYRPRPFEETMADTVAWLKSRA